MAELLLPAAAGAALTAYLLVRRLLERLPRLQNRAGRRWRTVMGLPSAGWGWGLQSRLRGTARAWRHRRERAGVDAGLEELITELAFLLRAGFSPVAALRHAGRELTGTVAKQLEEALGRYDSGQPLERTLQDLSSDLGPESAGLVVNALLIGMRTGGDLPAMLSGCARVLRNRRLLRAELSVQTAEARWSAAVVATAPLVLMVFFMVFQPGFLAPLTRAAWGGYAIAYAAGSWCLGVFLVAYLTRPEQLEPGGGSR